MSFTPGVRVAARPVAGRLHLGTVVGAGNGWVHVAWDEGGLSPLMREYEIREVTRGDQ